jgi:HD-like signal output (HDOD) protein
MQHSPAVPGHANINPRDAFLQKLDNEADLPATDAAVARVVQLASSDDYAVQDLTYFILANAGLTQKILRLANTVQYHTAARGKITTVSRAIFLLGFETVKTTALTMLLVEWLSNLKHSHAVSAELKRAMYASIIGREMARSSKKTEAEEAAIAALFANVGQIMVAAYEYPSYAEICELVKSGQMSEEQAAIHVLGFGYGTLSQSILRRWNIPETIMRAVIPLPAGMLKPAKRPHDWVQQIASFSIEATSLIAYPSEKKSRQTEAILLSRFGMALNLDKDKLEGLKQTVAAEFAELCRIMDWGGVEERQDEEAPGEEAQEIPVQFLMNQGSAPGDFQDKKRHPSGKPLQAKELLLEGVQQIMQMPATGHAKVNDIMLLVLETLFNSMGFRFAMICLKDRKENTFRARLVLGEDLQRRNSGFVFAPDGKKDLFVLAMESGSDLMISDATDMEIQDLLPAWHRKLLPDAKSFMVLPITVNQKTLGFFYGDRAMPAPEGLPADEAALVKILKTQMSSMLSNRQTLLD